MVGAAVINIVTTPILIFGWGPIPAFGIEGAAYGTLIARAITLIFSLYIIIMREQIVTLTLPKLAEFTRSFRNVAKIAVPAGTGSIINPISIAFVTSILATYGSDTVAAFGVATRIESFACIPMLALSASIGPIAGQNWGANGKSRIIEALKTCYSICFLWSSVLAIVFYFYAKQISGFIASSEAVNLEASAYLSVVSLSFFGYGIVIVSAAAFNALGRSVTGLSYYIIRSAVMYVPLSYLASLWFESVHIYYAIAASNAFAGIAVGIYSLWWLKKAKRCDCVPNAFPYAVNY
jgi:Na+-driven multidrug efflux pump